MKAKRLIIYPKDIMLITGKSERYSRYLHRKIKIHFSKLDHQPVSVKEFSEYMGLDGEEVQATLF